MNVASSPMVLIGIGTSGCRIARAISRAYGKEMRHFLIDTDASTAQEGEDFTLLGGDRLSGHGSGGDLVAARLAAEDSISHLDSKVEGVSLAVIVTSLGGGTGGGATLETIKRLNSLGIASIVFATTPFAFEGEDRQRNARGVMSMIEESAGTTFFLPLDKLIGNEDNMETALARAIDTVAGGVTLFWRLTATPGYLRLDVDRLRHIMTGSGRGRFATVTVQGTNRASDAVDQLIRSELLAVASAPVKSILVGVLAGEDLRLSEIGRISDGIREAFGERTSFELGTVNDELTFCGRLSTVVMIFEGNANADPGTSSSGVFGGRKPKKNRNTLGVGPVGRGRFNNADPTNFNGEDLDIPTFLRKNVNLDF